MFPYIFAGGQNLRLVQPECSSAPSSGSLIRRMVLLWLYKADHRPEGSSSAIALRNIMMADVIRHLLLLHRREAMPFSDVE